MILTTSGGRRPITPFDCLTLDRRPSLASAAFHSPFSLLQSASEDKYLPAPRCTASGKMNVLPTSTASQSSTVGPLAARYLFGPLSTGLFRKDIGFILWTLGITGKPFRWPCSGVAESATKPSTDTVIGLRPGSDIDFAELSAGSDILTVSLWILETRGNVDKQCGAQDRPKLWSQARGNVFAEGFLIGASICGTANQMTGCCLSDHFKADLETTTQENLAFYDLYLNPSENLLLC